MKAESIMNIESKWIEVKNTKESGADSGQVYATLTVEEKDSAQNIIGYRKQTEDKSVFYVSDSNLARKLFAGHFHESSKRF